MSTKAPTRTPKHPKPSASAYLMNPKPGRSMGARTQRYRIDGFPVDEALYGAFQAARPAILLYLNGKGPRPNDPTMWFNEQDRRGLRQLRVRRMAHDDPRYWDALIEAARAGDSLSKEEMKNLAEYARLMGDLGYHAMQKVAYELSAKAQTLGRTVADLQPKAKVHDSIVTGGRQGGRKTGGNRKDKATRWQKDIQNFYRLHPPIRPSSYRAEADRLLRELKHISLDKETLRKFLAKSQLCSTRFRFPSQRPQ